MKMSSLLLAISACCMLTPMAQANPSLARDWAEESKELNAEMSHGEETALSPELVFRLQRFGRTASRLAISGSETTPLPHDLGCIFRGMAEETTVQLSAMDDAENTSDVQAARARIVHMLDDAEMVGEAAALSLEAGELIDLSLHSEVGAQCSAGHLPESQAAITRSMN